jgi:hypothetical protein
MAAEQENLDLSSQVNERLARIRSLTQALSPTIGPDRTAGIVELLERIVIAAARSEDGLTSEARVSYLAAGIYGRRPVSEKTIRNWSTWAQELRLLNVDRRSHRFGGHRTNVWQIDGCRLLALAREPAILLTEEHGQPDFGRKPGGSGAERTSALGRNGLPPLLQPDGQFDHGSSEPEPEGAGPEIQNEEGKPANQKGKRYVPANPAARIPPELLADIPELATAATRLVSKKATEGLKYGTWEMIHESDLARPAKMLSWFRQQLSLRRPVTGATEAELLLVLAAASYAANCHASRVLKSRCALFVHLVNGAIWDGRVISRIRSVRRWLDELAAREGEFWIANEPVRDELSLQTEET